MRRASFAVALATFLVAAPFAGQGDVVWFRFTKKFINQYYPQEIAFGSMPSGELWTVGPAHYISDTKIVCSGTDGEVHVGVYEEDWPGSPFSYPVGIDKLAWGFVIEPPNVTQDDMKVLRDLQDTPATFDGYLRVWNEGHYDDEEEINEAGSSNPNHIFELHPSWRVVPANGVARTFPVAPMSNYRGYGLSKFKDVAATFNSGSWLRSYQTSASVYLSLLESSNFYQLPVIVRSVATAAGAKIVSADVCSDRACSSSQFLLTGLRVILVPSAEEGDSIDANDQVELLGIMSVNLRDAMEGSVGASKKSNAIFVRDALEFFAFGRAKHAPAKNSKCEPE